MSKQPSFSKFKDIPAITPELSAKGLFGHTCESSEKPMYKKHRGLFTPTHFLIQGRQRRETNGEELHPLEWEAHPVLA